jgi:hypothetical protein
MVGDESKSSVKETAKQLCESLDGVVELRSTPRTGVTLVRPDGYAAYSAHNHDSAAVLGEVRSLVERQTN